MAFRASGFKLNRQQVFGRVRIETPHRYLSEQTNREGLVHSEVSDALTRSSSVGHTAMSFEASSMRWTTKSGSSFGRNSLKTTRSYGRDNALKMAISDLRNELE